MISKKNSMFRRIAFILCGTAILQGIIFFAVIFGSDTFSSMTHDAYQMLSERADYRSKDLQAILNDNVHDVTIYKDTIEIAEQLYEIHNETIPSSLNEKIATGLIDILKTVKCSGAFVILDKELTQKSYYPTLYLRDSEPMTILPNNSDISALYGNSTIIKDLNIPLDPVWMSAVNLDESSSDADFYFKPFQAAKQYPDYDMDNLGYWSKPFHIQENDIEIITYTMPLFDHNKQVYGVIGLEFSTDFISGLLTYEELNNSTDSAYVLGILDQNQTMSDVVVKGPAYTYLKSQPIQLEKVNSFVSHVTNAREKTLSATIPLSMYNTNTPFSDQQWVLLGIVAEDSLLNNVHTLQQTLYLCIGIAILAALLATFLASYRFSNPIIQLRNHLKISSHDGAVSLPRVHILEIDELSAAIEDLSRDVAYASSRLSQILKIANIKVGAVEYDKHRNHVFCTDMVHELMEIDFPYENMSHEEFDQQVELFKKKIIRSKWEQTDASSNKICLIAYKSKTQQTEWLRIHIIDREDATLLVINQVSEEILEKKRLEHERDHDALTSLLNRRAFREQVSALLEQVEHTQGVMVMWDLDNLKYINDTYGHDMGDRYIRSAAETLGRLQGSHAIVARMAGDEFLVYLHSYQTAHEYKQIVRSLHMAMKETTLLLPDQTKQPIRASAGISWYPQDGKTYDELLKHADYAMYSAKNTIKGSIKEFNSISYQKDKILINGKEELNQIIEQNAVRFVYQPIVDAKTGEIFGYEALMRPLSEHITSPLDLLRIAKAQSKLYQIEYLTWMNVLKTCKKQKDAFKHKKIFINSIPNVTLTSKDLKELETTCQDILGNVVIEIIESDDLDLDCMNDKQTFANQHHIQIAIDDFGSGYNNDGMLLKITPDYIKIDMEIIQGVSHDSDRERLVSNIIQFAHSKKALVIAEGIEDLPDLQVCIKLGVDLLQGYYLGKPLDQMNSIHAEKQKLVRSLAKIYER